MKAGIAALLIGGCIPAAAGAAEPMLAPSPAIECLGPPADQRGAPEYPEELLYRKEGGTVKTELMFTAPDRPPRVRAIEKPNYQPEFLYAVRRYAERLRVPCMVPGQAPVTLRQDYVFVPNDGRKVMSSAPADGADEVRYKQLACMSRTDGLRRPDYPSRALREGQVGKVFVRLRFAAPDQPPEVETLAAPAYKLLTREVLSFAQGYRLPCLQDGPLDMTIVFNFKIVDGDLTVLRDTTLLNLVRAAKHIPRPAFFDLNTMSCPFEVRLEYYRPHQPNRVGELDTTSPARRPFLDWLSQLTLELPPAQNNAVLGDEMTVTVPCGKVDL